MISRSVHLETIIRRTEDELLRNFKMRLRMVLAKSNRGACKGSSFFALKTTPYMRTKLYISKGGIKDERNNKH